MNQTVPNCKPVASTTPPPTSITLIELLVGGMLSAVQRALLAGRTPSDCVPMQLVGLHGDLRRALDILADPQKCADLFEQASVEHALQPTVDVLRWGAQPAADRHI
jgi:hypothetical protein